MNILRTALCALVVLLSVNLSAMAQKEQAEEMQMLARTKLIQHDLQIALQKFTPEHPEVMALQNKLRELEKLTQARAASDAPFKTGTVSPLTSLQATVKGTFWRNAEWIKSLDLSSDQQKKMDDTFQQYRLKLIDLTATLQKEELILEPLLGNGRPAPEAEAKIMTQIDRIADARAELEKANSKMLVSVLQVLTAEQWAKLPMPAKKTPALLKSPTKAR